MKNVATSLITTDSSCQDQAKKRKQDNKKNLFSIQALRAIAAIGVVAYHSSHAITTYRLNSFSNRQEQFSSLGQAGVDIFFVISGFIMIYTTSHLFGQKRAAFSFLLRRIVRVAPLYWILSFMLLLLWISGAALKGAHFTLDYVIKSFMLVPSYRPSALPATIHPILDQGWTLSYEFYFYVVYAVFLRYSSPRATLICVPAIFSAVLLTTNVFFSANALVVFLKNPLALEFSFGLTWGYAYLKGFRLTRKVAIGIVALAVAIFLSSAIYMNPDVYRPIIWGVPSIMLMAGLTSLSYKDSKSHIKKIFAYLGDISYSLYLTHGFITLTLGNLLKTHVLQGLSVVILLCTALALSVLLGSLTYNFIEKPVTAFLHEKFKDRYTYVKS